MAAKANLTKSANVGTTAREIDFVSRFGQTWKALREIMGVSRPIVKPNGTQLNVKTATVTLQSGAVAEGDEIPYSLASVTSTPWGTITLEKYAKAVSIEAVAEHGAEYAVQKTDEAFLNQLRGNVMNKFYTFIQTGQLTGSKATFQAAFAKALGLVSTKFDSMDKEATEIVAFCNINDVYDYVGSANITVQNQFGLMYVENFLGASKVILSSKIPSGKVIATPAENIVMYYVNPADSEFAELGLEFATDSVLPIIGFHAEGDYKHMVGEMFALMGITLLAEYIDGIAVVDISAA